MLIMLTGNILNKYREQHYNQQYCLRRLVEGHGGEVQRMPLKAAPVPFKQQNERAEEQQRAQLQAALEYVPCLRAHCEHSIYNFPQLHFCFSFA